MNCLRLLAFWRNNTTTTNNRTTNYNDDDDDQDNYVAEGDKLKEFELEYGSDRLHIERLNKLLSLGFDIESELTYLGHGAFSVVKKGFSKKHHTDVAVKIIKNKATTEKFWNVALPNEINLWKELSHGTNRNVLMLLDEVRHLEYHYLISEVSDHGNCEELLMSGRISESRARPLFRGIASAVSYCHGLKIAHRDIKPQNLLIAVRGAEEIVKLADFGFVTKENPCHSCVGTPHMLAPEQLSSSGYNPFVSDMWQVGITLFLMLFNQRPFQGTNRRDVEFEMNRERSKNKEAIPFPRTKIISFQLKTLITGMLEVEPVLRWKIDRVEKSDWFKVI